MGTPTTTGMPGMSDLSKAIGGHLAAYAASDSEADRPAEPVQRLWAADGRLIDPPLAAAGHAQTIRQAGPLLAQFPGHRFVRSSGIDSHHGSAR